MTPPNNYPSEFPRDCAFGLSEQDIHQLLALVRKETSEKILAIRSVADYAEIETGFLANGEAGSGHDFVCVQNNGAWEIKETGMWMA